MKLFTGYLAFSLGLILTAATANAQTAPPQESGGAYHAVSDFYGPYGAAPQELPPYAAVPPRGPPYAPPPQVISTAPMVPRPRNSRLTPPCRLGARPTRRRLKFRPMRPCRRQRPIAPLCCRRRRSTPFFAGPVFGRLEFLARGACST
jgi:hypothetical protein